jgi:hypothetical protein
MAFRLLITFTGKHGDTWKVGCDQARIQDDLFRCFIKENRHDRDCCTYDCVFQEPMTLFKAISVNVREPNFGKPWDSFAEIKFELQPGEKIPDHISGNLQTMHDERITNARILENVELTGKYEATFEERSKARAKLREG